MVNKITATILLIAITAVLAMILFSSADKSGGTVTQATNPHIKVGYIVNGNRLTVVDITGNNSVPIPPGMMTIYSVDKASPIGADILWRGSYKNMIQAGTSITNNIDQGINLKMFYDNYPVIDAVVGPGYNTLINASLSSFGNGSCDGCTASSAIKFS